MLEQEEILTGDPIPKGKPKFNPNAAFETVKETPIPKSKKPAFNPKESFEPIHEETTAAQPEAFKIELSQPTFGAKSAPVTTHEGTIVSEEGIRGPKEFSFDKSYDPLAVTKLGGKAREAQAKLHTELQSNDKEYEKKLREYRRDSYTVENLREDYKNNGWILSPHDEQNILKKEKQKKYDAPIDDTDISDIKSGTLLNQSGSRKFIKDLKRNDVLENAYIVDKYNELANAPDGNHRVEKIKEVAKQIKKGEVIYDPEKKIAIKPLGLLGSIIEGTMNKFKGEEEHDFFKKAPDAAIINELENERNNPETDEPIKVPKGKAQEFLMMASEMPLSPMIAGAIGSLAGPQAGMAAGTAVGAYENRKIQYRATFKQVYNELRDQGVNENEALQEARSQAEDAQEIGTIVGAAQGYLGAKIGATPLKGANFGVGYQQAIGNLLKQNGSELGKILVEGAAQGGIGALGEVAKNKLAQAAGINRDIDAGTADQFWTNLMMTAGIGVAIKGGRGLSKINYKNVLNGLKNVPEEHINSVLQEKVNGGEITQEAADGALQQINDYKGLDQLIPDNVTEEARFKIQDKIQKRIELEQQVESTDKAYHPALKEKIKAIDEEIIALSKETEKPPKSESGLTRAKEKEAIETAEEFIAEGILPDTYKPMVEADPIGFWKMIAQQAQNRDENWKPLSEPIEESAVRDQFGDTVVEYAKELFPAPELPKSTENVSVIMPGEIKQPTEVITIKPQDNATTIRGDQTEISEGGDVGGQRPDARSEDLQQPAVEESIPAGTEQQAGIGQPEEKGAPTAEEKVSGIHAEQPPTQLSFRGLQEIANEFGYDDVKKRDKVTDVQERKNAEVTANEWASKGEYQSNIDDLLNRIENKEHVPTAKQRLILEQYLANERQKLRELPKTSAEYDAQLLKVKRIKDIGNIARSEAGAALRLPNEGTLPHPILDEVDAMTAKMDANGVDKLTEQQKAEVEAQVEKYKKAADEANQKTAKLEEQVSKIEAEKEFKKVKSTTKKTKKNKEDYVQDRKSLIEQLKQQREAHLKKLRDEGTQTMGGGLVITGEMAKTVGKIVKSYVEEGVNTLEEVVKAVHGSLKDVIDGITEKNVHDIIAGVYNEKKGPLSELQQQIRDLQEEAKLINQLEALERGVEPKAEKAKRERNQKIKALRDKIKDLKKEDGAEELLAIKKRNQKKEQEIRDKIAKGEFEKESKKSIFDREDVKQRHPDLRKQALDAIVKKEEAQHEFDLALFKDEMAKRPWYQKGASFAAKLIHTSKAVMSGIDDSATFVQNGLAMLANPKTGAKVWLKHWKEAFNDAQFKRELAALHERPDWEIIKNSGLEIVEPHSAASKQVEEAFEQNLLAGKFKISGKEFQPWKYTGGVFERAFTSMGNNMRVALFEKRMQMLKDEGKTFETHKKEYQDAARAINELTGRGKLPQGLAQAAPYISPFIWAPRMLTSTINALGISDIALGVVHKGYYQNLTPAARKFALAQLGRGVGMGVAIMGAASLAGAKVDYDPRSVTFGDIIIGDHHYNPFGRFVPVVKTLVQASFGIRVKKGQIEDLDNPKYGGKDRLSVIGGFFRGKVTPAVSAGMNLLQHRNYFTQEEFGVKDLPKALLMPMSINDLIEGWDNDGTSAILNRFLPAFEGLKVSDERDFDKKGEGGDSGGSSHAIKKGLNKTRSSHKIKHL